MNQLRYKYNSLFSDSDFCFKSKIHSLIKRDMYGYFIEFEILKKDIAPLIMDNLNIHYDNPKFIFDTNVTNQSSIIINGSKLDCLDKWTEIGSHSDIPKQRIILKELLLKHYASSTKRKRACYIERLVLSIPYTYLVKGEDVRNEYFKA